MPDVPGSVKQTNYRTEDGAVHAVILPDRFEGEGDEFDISVCGLWLVLKKEDAERLGMHEQLVAPTKEDVTCLLCLGA